ncbi:unnamed protein product [Acanthoscelides obtectus]|uniref:Uncharacterized protein n=1 Tax=Acanthoscelides obtectus TaxID=200917 RepID=A0A9P0LC68_ACAOB|nr:unnamed protein product [Acanthoscelides obtectus]CAK1651700.1 hypothetical protein AOBTE_LOCUS17399 [Acanthoscelides obtectus]
MYREYVVRRGGPQPAVYPDYRVFLGVHNAYHSHCPKQKHIPYFSAHNTTLGEHTSLPCTKSTRIASKQLCTTG